MKITFNNNALTLCVQKLNNLTQVSGKLGYAISKAKRQFMRELEPFEEQRGILFKKYGQKDPQTGELKISQNSEHYQDFINEITPLLQIETEIDIFQIPREEFESNESIFKVKDITVSDFDLLQELFILREQVKKDEQKQIKN